MGKRGLGSIALILTSIVLLVRLLSANAPSPVVDEPRVPDLTQFPDGRHPHKDNYELARSVPGFAGVYLDQSFRTHILLTDPTEAPQAKMLVAQSRGLSTEDAVIEQATYSFIQLSHWYYNTGLQVQVLRAGASLGISEQLNKIHIFAHSEDILHKVENILDNLPRIPHDAVHLELIGPIKLSHHTSLQSRIRPAPAGVQTVTVQS